MTIPSNLYADKIFSEHPISLYPLDDDVSYISLISDNQRLFDSGGWSASADNSASVVFNDSPSLPNLDSPFLSDIYSSFSASGVSASNTTISIESPVIFNLENLNQNLATFSLSLYLYQNSIKVNWYEVGYVYYDEFLSTDKEIVNRIDAAEGSQWINFDFSYTSPGFYNSDVRIVVRANVDDGGGPQDYSFIVNGICFGQWSENTSSKSLGVIPQSASVTTASVELFGVPAIEYGIQENSGYYLIENNRLLAKNAGIPLIYGSENVTRLYPSASALPSLITPGNGFLFESGKFKQFSAEFWMRINPDTLESRKIFGPLDTKDGLYVRDGVISLVLGNSIGSHPVSEWYRPMLVHVLLKNDTAALYINGEQVIEIPLIINEIEFAKENDWLGFYSYEDISNFEVDCFSLYSYLIPLPVAKKRFVWGQGTDAPQTVADFFDGTNTYINYSNANYTANKTYPDTGNWQAGYRDNLLATRRSISSPNYSLPEIFIEDRDINELYLDNKESNVDPEDLFFTFRPLSQSIENILNPLFSLGYLNAWSKINNTSISIKESPLTNQDKLRVASFNNWQRVFNDGAQILDWDTWDEDSWEDVLFLESSGFIAGTKISQRIQILPDVLYKFSLDATRNLGQANDAYIAIDWYDAAEAGTKIGTTIRSQQSTFDLNETKRLTALGFSPPGSSYAELSFYISESVVDTGEIYFVENAEFLSPDLNWTEKGYIFFESLSFVDNLSSVYGVFALRNLIDYAPIMMIRNVENNDKLNIFVENSYIKYTFNNALLYEEILDESSDFLYGYGTYGPEQPFYSFAAGFSIVEFIKNFGYQLSRFFKSINNLQLYVAGDGEKTFPGKIYSIGFANKNNKKNMSVLFLENGIADQFEYQDFLNNYATYTLRPFIRYNKFIMDISISAFWEEYFPLTSFASFVRSIEGNRYYDLDYLQLNLGYPSVTERVAEIIQNTGWTYQELRNFYNSPIQKSYEILDNELLSGYSSYNDLNNNNVVEYFLNTEKSGLRAYFTFQLLSEGANQPISSFPYSRDLIDCCFVDASIENTNNEPFKAYLTKFEFADNVVVFPPKNIDFKDVALVVHFEIKQDGILTNPLRVRDFEIASRALNQYEFNPIGTESAIPMYPYVKTGIYFDNKEKNPVLISKKRLPYLNLNQSSGIRVMGRQTFTKEFGIATPINQERKSNFAIGALQFWMKYDPPEFPSVPYSIFEIESLGKTIEFVVQSDASSKRGIIVARDKRTKLIENNLVYYQNGIRVKNFIVEFNTWESLGIEFQDPLIFDNIVGYFNIFRGPTFNNISFFNVSGLGETVGILARNWLRVFTEDDVSNFDWQYWYDENGLSPIRQWRDMYVVGETKSFIITPQDIYKSFVGTNRIIVDDGGAELDSESVTVYSSLTRVSNEIIVRESDISWTRFSDIPA
jgi:hypothetical protein